MNGAIFLLTYSLAIILSAASAFAVEPPGQALQSNAVSTTRQPLPVPLDEPETCPPPQTSSGVQTNSPAESPVPVLPSKTASTMPNASKPFTLVLFWGEGCPHCAAEKDFLKEIAGQFPSMQVKLYEVWHDRNNAGMLNRLAEKFGLRPPGVPITFISDKAYAGFSNARKNELIDIMKKCADSGCPDPLDRLKGEKN